MNFSFNQLSKPLANAILDLGYKEPTEIQAQTIPLLLNEETDFVGQAQTGTGKTAAFCIPLLEKIDFSSKGIQAMVLAPTRELANQINQELMRFASHLPLKTATVYGGVGYRDQIFNLRSAHVVIATPGRAIDLINKNQLKINNCKLFIIDEADEMLKMGFIEDVETLMDNISESAKTWMFSATMPKKIIDLIKTKLDSPKTISVKKETVSNANVSQYVCRLKKVDFIKALKTILITEDDFFGIVFCETKEETRSLSEKLLHLDKRIVFLHGDLSQRERDIAIDRFKSRKADVLICTDVGARGLDISNITHVINMGLPRKVDSYVHRIGRTGRAGQVGKAISFVSPSDYRNLSLIEKLTNQRLKNYTFSNSMMSKKNKINSELTKMDGLKKAISARGKDFNVDESFDLFLDYFENLGREDVIKLVFSYLFNNDLKMIDESVDNLKKTMLSKAPARSNERSWANKGNNKEMRRSPRPGFKRNSKSYSKKKIV